MTIDTVLHVLKRILGLFECFILFVEWVRANSSFDLRLIHNFSFVITNYSKEIGT